MVPLLPTEDGKPTKRYNQRAFWWDYHSPGIYMITIIKSEEVPTFSKIKCSSSGWASSDYLPLGYIIYRQINLFNKLHPEAVITHRAIMPDHVHFIIEVKEYLHDNVGLGRLIAVFKRGIRNEYLELYPESPLAKSEGSVFEKGFNDMILVRKGQLNNMIQYVKDNPRRHYIKKTNPEFFTTKHRIIIDGIEYQVIGNIFLLKNPELRAVRYSSRISTEEWEERKKSYNRTMDNGGILISPFIHPEEKKFLHEALETGEGVIIIKNRVYEERDKPGGKYFDLCAQGKLLIISFNKEGERKETITRNISLQMNQLAERIAENPESIKI